MSTTHVITQGEHLAVHAPGARISTLLGSCVACCLWDPVARVGGMNHILLATRPNCPEMVPNLSAINAMELLINDLLKLGASRKRLLAKVFGGASMVSGLSRIGALNADFVLEYLSREGISCVAQSLGGEFARQIVFTPSDGTVRMKMNERLPEEKIIPPRDSAGNGLEMF